MIFENQYVFDDCKMYVSDVRKNNKGEKYVYVNLFFFVQKMSHVTDLKIKGNIAFQSTREKHIYYCLLYSRWYQWLRKLDPKVNFKCDNDYSFGFYVRVIGKVNPKHITYLLMSDEMPA